MRIKISNEAEQYIKENGNSAMILLGNVTGCCGGAAQMSQIHLGSPENPLGYERNSIGDITVFVDKRLETEKQINIFLGRLLWLKRLSVEAY